MLVSALLPSSVLHWVLRTPLSSVSIPFCRGENERHRGLSGDQSPSELGSRVGSCLWEQGPLSPLESGIVPVSRRFQLTEVCLVSQPHAVSGGGGF